MKQKVKVKAGQATAHIDTEGHSFLLSDSDYELWKKQGTPTFVDIEFSDELHCSNCTRLLSVGVCTSECIGFPVYREPRIVNGCVVVCRNDEVKIAKQDAPAVEEVMTPREWLKANHHNSFIHDERVLAYAEYYHAQKSNYVDAECKKITGHNNQQERMAYDNGYSDHEKLMLDFIGKWDGSTNSILGMALSKVADKATDVWSDKEVATMLVQFKNDVENPNPTKHHFGTYGWLQHYKQSKHPQP